MLSTEFEAKITRPGISYEDRVNIVLSGWECLATSARSQLIDFSKLLYKWTLKLILQGNWPKLEKIVKTRLSATLQRCKRDSFLEPYCKSLIPLVLDPWGHPILKEIIDGHVVSDEEVCQYVKEEKWEVLRARVDTMVESRCEELALEVLKVCIRCIRLRSKEGFECPPFKVEDNNHFLDLYFVLIYKFHRKKFVEEINQIDVAEGVGMVRRLRAQQEKAKIWKNRLKIIELSCQIFLASAIVKPYEEVFSSIFIEWCEVMKCQELSFDLLSEMIRKYLRLSESSKHLYVIGNILQRIHGEQLSPLVTEIFIRALTIDLNDLEKVKMKTDTDNKHKLEHQMADGFMNLCTVFTQHVDVAKECVLTAFSLHPTQERLEKIKKFISTPPEAPIKTENEDECNNKVKMKDYNSNDNGLTREIKKEPKCVDDESDGYTEVVLANGIKIEVNDTVDPNSFLGEGLEEFHADDNVLSEIMIDTGQVIKDEPTLDLFGCNGRRLALENNVAARGNKMSTGDAISDEINRFDRFSNLDKYENSDEYGVAECLANFSNKAVENNPKMGGYESKIDETINGKLSKSDSVHHVDQAISNVLKKSEVRSRSRFYYYYPYSEDDRVMNELHTAEDVAVDTFYDKADKLIDQLSDIKANTKVEPSEVEMLESAMKAKENILKGKVLDSQPEYVVNAEKIGLSKEMCEDLTVVLSSPRWQVLSWVLPPSTLQSMCEKYIKDSMNQNNITKELKYLDLDYSQFRHLPSDDVDNNGIERGYEHFVEESEEEEDYCEEVITSDSENEFGKRPNYLVSKREENDFKIKQKPESFKTIVKNEPVTYCSDSNSDDDDFAVLPDKTRTKECFEGKRVTSISYNDHNRKRIRVDMVTGKVRDGDNKPMIDDLRMYRHNLANKPPKIRPKLAKQVSTFDLTKKTEPKQTSIKDEIRIPGPEFRPMSTISDDLLNKKDNVKAVLDQLVESKPESPFLKHFKSVTEMPVSQQSLVDQHNITKIKTVGCSNNNETTKSTTINVATDYARSYLYSLANNGSIAAKNALKNSDVKDPSFTKPPHSSADKSWKYSGCLVGVANKAPPQTPPAVQFYSKHASSMRPNSALRTNSIRPKSQQPTSVDSNFRQSVSIRHITPQANNRQATSIQSNNTGPSSSICSYINKGGKILTSNANSKYKEKSISNYEKFIKSSFSPKIAANISLFDKANITQNHRTDSINNTKYADCYEKFLFQKGNSSKNCYIPNISITRKSIVVNRKEKKKSFLGVKDEHAYNKNDQTAALRKAQKSVLDQLLSPDSARLAQLASPMQAIAMPVSHNPPNILSDKTNPAGLNRVLPRGTTVVRKTKSDSGAGSSGSSSSTSSNVSILYPNTFGSNSMNSIGSTGSNTSETLTNSLSHITNSGNINARTHSQTNLSVLSDPPLCLSRLGSISSSVGEIRSNILSSSLINNGSSSGLSTISSSPFVQAQTSLPVQVRLTSNSPCSTTGSYSVGINSHIQQVNANLIRTIVDNQNTRIIKDQTTQSRTAANFSISSQPSPLVQATVSGSAPSQSLSISHNSGRRLLAPLGSTVGGRTLATPHTVVSLGEGRTSMLESLLRDRVTPILASVQHSPLIQPNSNSSQLIIQTHPSSHNPLVIQAPHSPISSTATSPSIREPVVVSGHAVSGASSATPILSASLSAPPLSISVPVSSLLPAVVSDGGAIQSNTGRMENSSSLLTQSSSDDGTSGSAGMVSIGGGTVNIGGTTSVIVPFGGSAGGGTTISNTTSSVSAAGGPLLLPGQLIQVQVSDGSTGLGIVHSGSLDLRLPPGTRVIKSNSSPIRGGASSSVVSLNQPAIPATSRPVNVLHNVKILQNRQFVRTVVMPHSVALQTLGAQPGSQIVALNQNATTFQDNKVQTSLQKVLGQNIIPGGLVIRAVRPQPAAANDSPKPTTSSVGISTERVEIKEEKPKFIPIGQEEGLGERLSRHYLKTALLSSTQSTQSVGTQTQTTAVKPASGQIVNQVVMNHLRGVGGTALQGQITLSPSIPSSPSSSGQITPLSLGPNAFSSETLEQLREFESVFEKVSNKSTMDGESESQPPFSAPSVSSEESMIAAQLLSMAGEPQQQQQTVTTTATTGTSFIYSVPSSDSSPLTSVSLSTNAATITNRLSEGTFITIPSSTHSGTLILVNPSAGPAGLVAVSGTSLQTTQPPQPPPAASPALSSTSSHSSVSSSPSSTSGKNKKSSHPSAAPSPSPTKSRSPPPPKVTPKPPIAKPQVEESDEMKARVQAILDQYTTDLANTPQPQPAPRNRKNCPPPKNEGKGSSKKKGGVKKTDGSSTSSQSPLNPNLAAPSPATLSLTGEDSEEGSICGSNSHTYQGSSSQDEVKEEQQNQQTRQVVVSSVKTETPQFTTVGTLGGGRLVQLIRHGSKFTAITTRPNYQKPKVAVGAGLTQGGPPPNVTIQGRINMNDLIESQLASLLSSGGSANINQASLLSKLIQSGQGGPLQQVVIQTTSGNQVIQQLALQPIISSNLLGTAGSSMAKEDGNIEKAANPLPHVSMEEPPSPMQKVVSPPSSPSPTTPFPPPMLGDDDDMSEHEGSLGAAPLPPFFTLTQKFMGAPKKNSDLGHGSKVSSIDLSTSSKDSTPCPPYNKIIERISSQDSSGGSAPPSPELSSKELGLNLCSVSAPSSLEASPCGIQRLKSQGTSEQLRSNSLESLRSDLSVDEAHIPPSPATLTKQLQNAYMTDAALSPSVGHPHLSASSAYSSPSTAELHFQNAQISDATLAEGNSHLSTESHLNNRRLIENNFLGQSSSSSASSLTSNSNQDMSNIGGLDGNSLACLSSPSGDVYLDQGSVGLLDPSLVATRSQSPSLSDLVPPGPMLSWSPHGSADSMMGQSPSLNEALTGGSLSGPMASLDVPPSEDSLCDSSTGFPLFAMEDPASVSSSTSEEMPTSVGLPSLQQSSMGDGLSNPNSTHDGSPSPSSSFNLSSHLDASKFYDSSQIRLGLNTEQDETVSSTRSDDRMHHDILDARPGVSKVEDDNRIDDSHNNPLSDPERDKPNINDPLMVSIEENPWRFDPMNDSSESNASPVSLRHSPAICYFSRRKGHKKGQSMSPNVKEEEIKDDKIKDEGREMRRRSQRQHNIGMVEPENKLSLPHNGYEDIKDMKMEAKSEVKEETKEKYKKGNPVGRPRKHEVKLEVKMESSDPRRTRGSKRRSEEKGTVQDDGKKRRSGINNNNSRPLVEDDAPRSLRSRHLSGTSDSSSTYSMDRASVISDRVSTPPVDSPFGGTEKGNSKRRRRLSHDSSMSSRDGSPLLSPFPAHEGNSSIVHTNRRSSGRDHAKKTRCGCCSGEQAGTKRSGRGAKGAGPSAS